MNAETIARRVLSEFEEMPGMTLTLRQAARLFGLDQDFCREIMDTLIDSAYLRQTSGGTITLGDRVAA
jgi:DNA-binding IclR family transcriptional regulator